MRSLRSAASRRAFTLLALSLSLAILCAVSSCAAKPAVFWKGADGTVIEWNRAKPLLADELELVVRLPTNPIPSATVPATGSPEAASGSTGLTTASDLRDGRGAVIEPLLAEPRANGTRVTYRFRVESSGTYTWGTERDRHMLFAVETVAGDQKELKKLDPAGLWGKK